MFMQSEGEERRVVAEGQIQPQLCLSPSLFHLQQESKQFFLCLREIYRASSFHPERDKGEVGCQKWGQMKCD